MNDYVSCECFYEDEIHMALMVSNDPLCFEEVVKSPNWRLIMDDEIKSINELPVEAKNIKVKWVYKTKSNKNGRIDNYKAMLIAKGYSQKHGVDFTRVYALVARMNTVRMIIAFAGHKS